MRNIFIILLAFIIGCKSKAEEPETATVSSHTQSYSSRSSNNDDDNENRYPDGTYCAQVEYYNPNSGSSSTYTLSVEVEDNEITMIHWSNGGWLDNSHFTPEELDEDGTASFTSDRGYQYTVTITSSTPCGRSSSVFNQEENDEENENGDDENNEEEPEENL